MVVVVHGTSPPVFHGPFDFIPLAYLFSIMGVPDVLLPYDVVNVKFLVVIDHPLGGGVGAPLVLRVR